MKLFNFLNKDNKTCNNGIHQKVCDCMCHQKGVNMLHIVACCHLKKCPDCHKTLNVR